MPTPDRSGPRRPRRDSDSARPARPSGAGARGPRRDDSRPSRPRRDDDRPSRPRSFDSDRPSRPRRDDDRPAGRGRPSSGRPSSGRPSSGRPSAGGRFADRDSRPSRPRGEDDRPSRARSFDSDRPSRPRRDDDRPPTRGRFGDRPDRPSRPRRDDDRSVGRGRPSSGRPSSGGRFGDRDSRPSRPRGDDDRPSRARSFDDRPARPQTDAQRRADQVRSRTGGRRNDRDAAPRNDHQQERWNDEGSTRAPRRGSGSRDNDAPIHLERDEKRASAPALAHVEATVGKKIAGIVGDPAAKRLIGKLALALDAFEKGRYQDAKRIIIPITRECEGVHLIHEIAGLSLYRLGQWRDAADHLEKARAAMPASTLNHPVLADCYRALMRYERVDELWKELKDASPDPAIVAEGRIVAASAQADKGDIQNAVRIMQQTKKDPAKVREHHLREWYVLADLYDRSGDVINAREWFKKIAHNDPDFSDIRDRLAAIGSH
ncbi:MAG: hypothetical protein RL438_599 [Actinomycetota bacterium]